MQLIRIQKISNKEMQFTGFVSLIGSPNVGKSTLINNIIGEKVSIVTHKRQTTRSVLKGIFVKEQTQIIFLDTPGIFEANRFIDKMMVKTAWKYSNESNIICLLYDASKSKISQETIKILEILKAQKASVILIFNKVDLISKKELLPLISKFKDLFSFKEVFMLSALNGSGIVALVDYLINEMPECPFLYDSDYITDTPQRQIASEILREKLFLNLHDEIPYNLVVDNEIWNEKKNNSIEIHQNIYVTKNSHKAMIIGHSGNNIKRIGIIARKEMETLFSKKIHLYIRVKIKDNCLTDLKLLESSGLDTSA